MKSTAPILLVEDDLVDVMTVRRALRDLETTNPLHVVGNGEDALKWLRGIGEALPGLILLDLNMPRMNGLEFLERIKIEPEFRRIPVVVLTTSSEERDRVRSFDLNVAGYMTKPVGYPEFLKVMKTIAAYWAMSETGT
jgi:CheY-like chemotaxis protein